MNKLNGQRERTPFEKILANLYIRGENPNSWIEEEIAQARAKIIELLPKGKSCLTDDCDVCAGRMQYRAELLKIFGGE